MPRRRQFARFQRVLGDEPGLLRDRRRVRGPHARALGRSRCGSIDEDGRPRFGWRRSTGHLEAGQIEFRASGRRRRDHGCASTIESWARSADRLSDFLYHRLRMAKEVQLAHVDLVPWRAVSRGCRGARSDGGDRHRHPCASTTYLRQLAGAVAESMRRRRRRLARRFRSTTTRRNWISSTRPGVARRRSLLSRSSPRPPGPPVEGGSCGDRRAADRSGYEFADPSLVRARSTTGDAPSLGREDGARACGR